MGRNRLTLTGVFLETGKQIAVEYKGRIVDACALQLVLDPWQYDVIVTTNLFGDILSDLIAGLAAGLMLDYVGLTQHATQLRQAIDIVLNGDNRLLDVTPDQVTVGCRFLVYQNRVAYENYTFIGRRIDILRRNGDSWLIARRGLILEQNVLLAKNLSIFF